jgi:2-oxoglutarate ferredoxin oxidoreductase subunit beta
MDRNHMIETMRRAHDHKGSAVVEIYQNCNVFNDGAFERITGKEVRTDMTIPLHHGEPIVFGTDGDKGVVADPDGRLRVVPVADVGLDRILVHDESRDDPGLAFALSRLSRGPFEPTPIGVFRAVSRAEYASESDRQVATEIERSGAGDLAALLRSGATWDVPAEA